MTRWHVSSDINISIESLTKKRFTSLYTNKALKYVPHYACFILARKLLQGYENILDSQWNDCFFLIRLYLRPNSSASHNQDLNNGISTDSAYVKQVIK